MLKLENIMLSFNLLKTIFFLNINFLFLRKKLIFVKIGLKKSLKKKNSTIFMLTKSNNFLKMYVIGYKYKFKKFISKKFIKYISFKFKKKYTIYYLKKIIRLMFLKLFILNNSLNLSFFIKIKKKSISNAILKKYKFKGNKFKKRKFLNNNITWIYFIIIRKLLKKKSLNVKFFILFNKSHSKMNEKSKKLRRK